MIMALDAFHLVSGLEFSVGLSLVFNMSILYYYVIYLFVFFLLSTSVLWVFLL